MVSVPATPSRPKSAAYLDPGWARTGGDTRRPFALDEAAYAANLVVSELPARLGISWRVASKLLDVGLTRHQARTVGELLGVDPFDVWPSYDETLDSFLARHESGPCPLCWLCPR